MLHVYIVTCMDELHHCRKLGITSPIGIIPNPVEIKKYPCYKQDEKFRLGYLGRIFSQKKHTRINTSMY